MSTKRAAKADVTLLNNLKQKCESAQKSLDAAREISAKAELDFFETVKSVSLAHARFQVGDRASAVIRGVREEVAVDAVQPTNEVYTIRQRASALTEIPECRYEVYVVRNGRAQQTAWYVSDSKMEAIQ